MSHIQCMASFFPSGRGQKPGPAAIRRAAGVARQGL
jgi:hypothetical protein